MNKTLLLLSTALIINACSPVIAQRGNMLENYQVEELKLNESKRSDVLRSLGSPTTRSTFDNNVWYYIGQETEKRGIFDPKVVKERVVLVAFDDEGTLEAIEDVDRKRINIPYVRNKTKTHGNDRTLVQEFLGNLGKFNPQNESAATAGGDGI